MINSIFSVSSVGLVVQLLGFVKLLLVAKFYGVGSDLDAYYLALILPSLLLGFVGGGLQSSFMPVYGRLLSSGDVAAANRLLVQVSFWLLILLLPVAALIAWFAPEFISLTSFSGSPSSGVVIGASAALAVLIFSFVINSVVDFWGLVFNASGRFGVVALAPIVNILVSSLPILFVEDPKLGVLVWGLIAGLLTQLLVLWVASQFSVGGGRKVVSLFPVFSLKGGASSNAGVLNEGWRAWLFSADISRVWSLCLPAFLGVAVTNTNFAIDQAMAVGAGEGALSILNYASRFHNVIVQAGIMAVSVVLLPRFIDLLANKQYSDLFKLLRRMLLAALILGGLAFFAVLVLGLWGLELILGFTALTAIEIEEIFGVWLWYSAGLFATAMCVFYVKLFQAWQMPGFITGLALMSLCLNVLLNWLLIPVMGVSGIALATTLVYLLALVVYMVVAARLKRRYV